jgi:hypothetical protein
MTTESQYGCSQNRAVATAKGNGLRSARHA